MKWSVSKEIGDAARASIKEAGKGLEDVMKEFGEESIGKGASGLMNELGTSPRERQMEAHYIMVPVNEGSVPVATPVGNTAPIRRSGGAAPKSVFNEAGSEPLRIITKGVDELGNIRIMLKGNCPRCGLYFGEGKTEMEGTKSKTTEDGKLYNVKKGKGSDIDLPRADIPDYQGSGSAPLVASEGKLGGRFRKQSLRPGAKEGSAHAGIDAPAKVGTPIYSPEEGKVIHVGEAKGSGRNVQVQHPSAETSWFMHLDKISKNIKVGENVKKGSAVGTVGRTQDVGGKGTTSPHLHYEVLKPGVSSEGAVARPVSHSQEAFGLREDPEKFIESTGSTIFEGNQ